MKVASSTPNSCLFHLTVVTDVAKAKICKCMQDITHMLSTWLYIYLKRSLPSVYSTYTQKPFALESARFIGFFRSDKSLGTEGGNVNIQRQYFAAKF